MMENYYKKIRKKSISSILLGIGLMGISVYMIWDYTLGMGVYSKDRMIMIAIGCVLLLFGVFLLVSSFRSVQTLKKNMKKSGISESELANDLAAGKEFSLCNIGKRYALNCTGTLDVILLENALVVYPQVEVRESNGYSNYNYYIYITERSGNEKCLEAKNENEMEQIFDNVMEIAPYAITQNDSVVDELRKKNLSELVRIVEQRKKELQSK